MILASATTSLTRSSYTDTDLDPYNAERGFWWVSGESFFRVCANCLLILKYSLTSCGC